MDPALALPRGGLTARQAVRIHARKTFDPILHNRNLVMKNKFKHVIPSDTNNIAPRWLTYPGASAYSGLGTRVLENHVKAGFIRSSRACAPGNTRGRTLIDRQSLDAFIEAGVSREPAELAMNSNRGGRNQ